MNSYNSTPESQTSKYMKLGGYLALYFTVYIINTIMWTLEMMVLFNTYSSSPYKPFALVLAFMFVSYGVITCYSIYSIHNEKSHDVLFVISIVKIFMHIAYAIIVQNVLNDYAYVQSPVVSCVLNVIMTLIWIAYLEKSKRVLIYFNINTSVDAEDDTQSN